MHPSFVQFVDALRTPAHRSAIRLVITEEDATRLLSNDTWMRDYYTQWIALFPAATASVPSRVPRVGPVLIVGGLIAACLAVAVVALVVPHPSGAIGAGDKHPGSSISTPSATPSNPAGLTTAEVELLNAELAVSDSSIDKLVAGGTTEAQLKQVAQLETGIADLACTEYAKLPDGFETAGAKDKTIAGLTKGITVLGRTVTPTQAQAERVWTAIEGYCESTKDPSPSATP
jgi:hypothetical protein